MARALRSVILQVVGFSAFMSAMCPPASAATLAFASWDPGSGVLTTSLTVNVVNDLCCGGASDTLEPTAIPFIDSHAASSGFVRAETSYDISSSAIEITFVEQRRDARSAVHSSGFVYFTFDTDVQYDLAGSYALQGWRNIGLELELFDLTSGVSLFRNDQESGQTLNEAFVLGEQGGDSLNLLSGSLQGGLSAGNVYRLRYAAAITSTEAGDSVATASGYLSLTFVPEPGTALLIATCLGVLSAHGRSCARRISAPGFVAQATAGYSPPSSASTFFGSSISRETRRPSR